VITAVTRTSKLPPQQLRVGSGASSIAQLRRTAYLRKMVARLGAAAGFEYPVHPHQLRHGCGFKLANDGHDTRSLQAYLGHKNIAHTVRYTELAPTRFRHFWKD
jgi:site-specific recombinase XerD